MDAVLKEKMDAWEQRFKIIEAHIKDQGSDINEIKVGILGSNFSKDGGLVGRLEENEKDIDRLRDKEEKDFNLLRERIEKLEKSDSEKGFKDKFLWSLIGAVASGLIMFLLTKLIGK